MTLCGCQSEKISSAELRMSTDVRWAGLKVYFRISWHFHLTVSRAPALFYTAASCEQGGAEGPHCTQGHLRSNSCVVFQNTQQQVWASQVPQIKKRWQSPTLSSSLNEFSITQPNPAFFPRVWTSSHIWNPRVLASRDKAPYDAAGLSTALMPY